MRIESGNRAMFRGRPPRKGLGGLFLLCRVNGFSGADCLGVRCLMKAQAGRTKDVATHATALTVNRTKRRAAIGAQRDALLAAEQTVLVVHAAYLHNAAIKIIAHLRAVLYHRGAGTSSGVLSRCFRIALPGEAAVGSNWKSDATLPAIGCKGGRRPIS